MTTEQQGVSFDPGTHTSGGFLNDIDATIVKSEVVEFDFKGKSKDGKAQCCLAVSYKPFDAESDDDIQVDYLRLGSLEQFIPSPDNKRVVPVGSKTTFDRKSKISVYFRALIQAGFPANKVGLDASVIEGLHVHLNTVPLEGMGKDKEGKDIEGKVTIITKILDKGPDGKAAKTTAKPAAAKSTTSAATTAAAPAAAAAPEGAEDKAIETVLSVLAEKGGKVAKTVLPSELFKRITDGPTRNAVIKIVGNAEWLGAADRPWKLDGGELSLG